MSYLKDSLKQIFIQIVNNTKDQAYLEQIVSLCLGRMNYGVGAVPAESGEKYALEHIKNKLQKKKQVIIFDVGANRGDYTQLIIDTFEGSRIPILVYSFEPVRSTFRGLSKRFECRDEVKVFNIGFSDKKGSRPIYYSTRNSALSSIYKRDLKHINITLSGVENIALTTIDTFCAQNRIPNIDLLKVDAEGHEFNIFQGAQEQIKRNRIDNIQFEFGGCNIDSRTFFKDFYYLLSDKYEIYRILRDGLYSVEQYKEDYEVFKTVNYFAKLRKRTFHGRS